MQCDNCRTEDALAFTLAAYPSEDGNAVLVDFCSIDCLQAWTSTGDGGVDNWTWGVQESQQRDQRDQRDQRKRLEQRDVVTPTQ